MKPSSLLPALAASALLAGTLAPANAAELWPRCDGAIVGTFCKRDGLVGNPVDLARVRALRRACPPDPR